MLRALSFSIFIFFCLKVQAQWANSWIDYGKAYYYFPISEAGIYRISYATLGNAGFPVSLVNPQQIQLFARGKQVPIYIEGENDQVFNTSDFIEFFAEGNDGSFEKEIYDDTLSQLNPRFSLFNDTIYYYLTIGNNVSGSLRISFPNEIDFNNYQPSSFCYREAYIGPKTPQFSPAFYFGEIYNGGITNIIFNKTSGWFDGVIGYGQSRNYNFNLPDFVNVGQLCRVSGAVTTQSNTSLNIDHQLRVEVNNQLLVNSQGDGYKVYDFNNPVNPQVLSTNFNIRVSSAQLPINPNIQRTATAFLNVRYTSNYNFNNADKFEFFQPDAGTQNKSMPSFNHTASQLVIYNLSDRVRYRTQNSGGNHRLLISNSNKEKRCFGSVSSQIVNITTIKPVSGSGFFENYTLEESEFCIVYAEELEAGANQYRQYRSQQFSTQAVNIMQLYHQFGNGVPKSPIAIRNFLKYKLATQQTQSLKHVLMLGKGLHHNAVRFNNALQNENKLPGLGTRSTDMLLVYNLTGTKQIDISIGRIAAQNNSDVQVYLQKLQQYEAAYSQAPSPWMKQAIHFGGGTTQNEQNTLRYFLSNYADSIEGPFAAMNVTTILKTTSAPIDNSLTSVIRNRINEGVNMMTFFGHASGSSFDINIDEPSAYNNTGKYPILLALSCLAGDLSIPGAQSSTSEKFVLIPQKGAIGFMASVGPGLVNFLNIYSGFFHNEMTRNNYGGKLGEMMKNASNRSMSFIPPFPAFVTNMLEMNLHGDPAIQFYQPQKPDISINENKIQITNTNINTGQDSIYLKVILNNLGKGIDESFGITVKRTYGNSSVKEFFFTKSRLFYQDTLKIAIPMESEIAAGINRIEWICDSQNSIDELNESNNSANLEILINSATVLPVYPPPYAIVGKKQQKLKAIASAQLQAKTIYFEIDTSFYFNSPIKETYNVSTTGGLLEWQPVLTQNMADSMVYFWRVGTMVQDTMRWENGSFRFIENRYGYGHARPHQLSNNQYRFINYNPDNQSSQFLPTSRDLFCRNLGNPPSLASLNSIEYRLDADLQDMNACQSTPSIHVAVIDPKTLQAWGNRWQNPSGVIENPTHFFGNVNDLGSCRNYRVEKYFIFRATSQSNLLQLADMISNAVPDSFHLLIYSVFQPLTQDWPNQVHQAFENLGATGLRVLPSNFPFIFYVQKGKINTAVTVTGDDPSSSITLTRRLNATRNFGAIESPKIGPADNFTSFWTKMRSQDALNTDSISFQLKAYTGTGSIVTLFNESGLNIDRQNIGGVTQSAEARYLQLFWNLEDPVQFTPAHLKEYAVIHEPLPEIMLNPFRFEYQATQEINEGEEIKIKIPVQNIGPVRMDSVRISYQISNGNQTQTKLKFIPALDPDSIFIDSEMFSSIGFSGNANLRIEVNPKDRFHRSEQLHFNNLHLTQVKIKGDNINPLLDVTFDGIHIVNREIVSPNPEISVRLKDENKFRLLTDTAYLAIYITEPGKSERRLFFGNNYYDSYLQFKPANTNNNTCEIQFKPRFTQDGIYQMRIQATDASNNRSGANDYVVQFEVVTRSSITQVLNYPNPFTTYTRFVFTLTGDVVPDEFYIQIMTVTGKVVRELYLHDLGPIRIGKNITQYGWDGKDDFGDYVGNGVYFYKVVSRIKGNSIERRESDADRFIERGYGKMYLMR